MPGVPPGLPPRVPSGASAAASRSAGPEAKWCHFAFDTAGAPVSLLRLSEAALIPKERSTLSFLLAGPLTGAGREEPAVDSAPGSAGVLATRIISDPFPLEDKRSFGRYGCSGRGLVLASGKRGEVEGLQSGALESLTVKDPEQRDGKSGALVAGLFPVL
jgi:hypothetical protein